MDRSRTDSVDIVLAAVANCAVRVPPRTRAGLLNAAHSAAHLAETDRIDVDTRGTESTPQLAVLAHEALVEEFSQNPTTELLSLTVRVGALCRELKRHE